MKILFLDGTEGYHPRRLEEKPTGGILTSLTLVPRYLASKGLDVTVASVCQDEMTYHGVKYIKLPVEHNDWDVVVFNRNALGHTLLHHFHGARKIWWLHDIVDHRYLEDDGYRFVDDVVALSRYCRTSYSDYYDIPLSKFSIIPNAVDNKIFYADNRQRQRNVYLVASAPVKGFYPIEYVFENMRRHTPAFEIKMYCNQSLHSLSNSVNIEQMLGKLKQVGINVLDPIPQAQLAEEMRSAWALLMLNHYPEIHSNVLLQAKACGLPVIATNIGSVGEEIVHAETGLLTHTYPHDMFWWWADCARLAGQLYMDTSLHDRISKASPNTVLHWDQVGQLWLELITGRKTLGSKLMALVGVS